MKTVPCPRCGMLLDLEEAVCPHCRTPWDDREIEEGLERIKQEELRLKKRPRRIKAAAAAAVLLAAGWLLRGRIAASVAASWGEFAAEVEKTRQPGHWRKSQEPEPLAAGAPKPEVAVSSFVYLNTSSPNTSSPPPAQEAPAPPEEPAPALTPTPIFPTPAFVLEPVRSQNELRVHGLVYDLDTALPVAGVKIRFIQKQLSSIWETTTDSAGRYQAAIYKNVQGPISVMIEADGYRKGLLEDTDPPYRERSPQARAELIAETIDSDLEPVPLRYRQSADIVELDLVLVPLAKK